jgi:hypothetical protein
MKRNQYLFSIASFVITLLIPITSHAVISDNFYPAGTTQLGWYLIPADAVAAGIPIPEYVGSDSFYTNVLPNPSADSALMRVGNFTTNVNFGVGTYLAGDTAVTVTYTDYEVEAWIYMVVSDSTRRHQHILFARNPGNDRFAPQLHYNPNGATGAVGPGIGIRGTAEGSMILTDPGLTTNQWVWMKIKVNGSVMDAYASWNGDRVDDLGVLGKGLDITAYPAGGFGVEHVINDPGGGAAAVINQPMYVDDFIVRFPGDLIIVPNPSFILTNPGNSPIPISITGGIPDYTWTITSGIGSLSTTAGTSNTFTPATTLGSGTITITDSASVTANIPVSVVGTSAPLYHEVTVIPADRRKISAFELFQ